MTVYSSIRLTAEDLERLAGYRDRLALRVRRSPRRFPAYLQGSQISLANAIRFLVYQADSHDSRNAACKLRAKTRNLIGVANALATGQDAQPTEEPRTGRHDVASDEPFFGGG
jgi:alkylhydroperoxidase/carboxymuconolactone decarboxylase family protein YurZ